MRGGGGRGVRRRWRRRLETIYEDEEFLAGPYPEMESNVLVASIQLVSDWVEQILPCWFGESEDGMCVWRV